MKFKQKLGILKKYRFIICIIVFAIIKQILVANIPITPYPNQGYDDNMMVDMAVQIRAGDWLGEYTSNTLVKGSFFPFLLAVINYLGFSYIGVMNLIYTIACIYFIYTIKDIFKTKKSLFAIYLILLFNPVSYAFWTLQRVYRNGITLAQAIVVIGSLFAMYQRRNKKVRDMLPFAIIGGLTLASLWLTREDGIWILPFVLVVTLIVLISILYMKIKEKKKFKITKTLVGKVIVSILPLIILFGSMNVIRTINYAKYGVYVYNEINDGYFGKVIKAMYSVKTDEDIQYVTVTRNKLNKIYEYSETLSSIKPQMEASMDAWDYNDRHPGDTQVEDGWFWWALKEAGENAGIYENAQTANEFYRKVYEEIEQAKKDGNLETQMSMPSNLMSPWKASYWTELPKTMIEITWYIINFEDVETVNYAVDIPDDADGIRRFEAFTNNLAVGNTEDTNVDYITKYTEKYVDRLNFIGNIYQISGAVIAIIAFICYIIMTMKLIKSKDKSDTLDAWLLITGVGLSLVVLILGVSYNHITSCYSKYYMYLSGAYPLVTIVCIASICYILERINWKKIWKKEKNKK